MTRSKTVYIRFYGQFLRPENLEKHQKHWVQEAVNLSGYFFGGGGGNSFKIAFFFWRPTFFRFRCCGWTPVWHDIIRIVKKKCTQQGLCWNTALQQMLLWMIDQNQCRPESVQVWSALWWNIKSRSWGQMGALSFFFRHPNPACPNFSKQGQTW